jgi:MFS family permease
MVPQGVGAMITMPIAGALADRLPIGRIVPFGLIAIVVGMFSLTMVGPDTSYWGFIIPVLFLVGLGMGATMMPLMTSALKTLTNHQVARGSTLLNITQQVASSIGVAVISVVFTNYVNNADTAGAVLASRFDPSIAERLGPQGMAAAVAELADLYGKTFMVAAILCAATLVFAYFLPRRHEESHLLDEEAPEAPVVLH